MLPAFENISFRFVFTENRNVFTQNRHAPTQIRIAHAIHPLTWWGTEGFAERTSTQGDCRQRRNTTNSQQSTANNQPNTTIRFRSKMILCTTVLRKHCSVAFSSRTVMCSPRTVMRALKTAIYLVECPISLARRVCKGCALLSSRYAYIGWRRRLPGGGGLFGAPTAEFLVVCIN